MNESYMAMKVAVDGLELMYAREDSVQDKVKTGKLEILLDQFASKSAGFIYTIQRGHRYSPSSRLLLIILSNPQMPECSVG